jgi:rhodanese-related sulfurtransferase
VSSFLLENWPLVLMALTSGFFLLRPLLGQAGAGGGVSPAEAVRLINREKGVLIDVCEPAEYAAGHAQGARNIPLGTLDGSKDLPSNKALPLIVLCASGARAGRAAGALRKAGHAQAVALAGGNKAWAEASLPMAKGSGKSDSKSDGKGDGGGKKA